VGVQGFGQSWKARFAAVATASVVAAGLFVQTAVPAGAAKPGFAKVATHAWAAAQRTSTGNALVDLEVFEGKVYAGYGDYGANTGPITVAGFDPAAGAFGAEFTSDTEAIYNLREVGGRLVAPATDPRTRADFAESGPWADARPLGATHVFDTVSLDGSDLWMVGSKGYDAVAWRSVDGGATWQTALVAPPVASGTYARFYFAAVLTGKLYVHGVDSNGVSHPTSKVFDGSGWSDGPSIVGGAIGWRPVPYAGGVLFHGFGHGRTSSVYFFDGTTSRPVGYGYDFEVVGDTVYLLDSSGSVTKSSNLSRWQRVAAGPVGSRSLAVDNGTIYIGTATSELWSYGCGRKCS
jgi:hypothetical protein